MELVWWVRVEIVYSVLLDNSPEDAQVQKVCWIKSESELSQLIQNV